MYVVACFTMRDGYREALRVRGLCARLEQHRVDLGGDWQCSGRCCMGGHRRLVLYGWGLVVGGVLLFLINPPEGLLGAPGDLWKFGFALSNNLGVFLLASRKEMPRPLAGRFGGDDRRHQPDAGGS